MDSGTVPGIADQFFIDTTNLLCLHTIQIEKPTITILSKLRFLEFQFHYLKDVAPITLTQSGSFVTNPGSVRAEPVITVYGTGTITLMVGMTITELKGVLGSVTLDTPLMEAYSEATSMNSAMSGNFPVLLPGQNAVSWTGSVTKVEIRPNWRVL